MTNANHVHFEKNMFTQMAATGLDFVSGTNNDMILGNVFTDIGGCRLLDREVRGQRHDRISHRLQPDGHERNLHANDTSQRQLHHQRDHRIPRGGAGLRGATRGRVDIEHNEVSIRQLHGDLGRLRVEQFARTRCRTTQSTTTTFTTSCRSWPMGRPSIPCPTRRPIPSHGIQLRPRLRDGPWADYGTATLYFDEGTRGYTAEHNVMVNCNGQINTNSDDKFDTCNSGGGNTITDNSSNPSGAQTTIADAGLEPAYVNIKNMTVPAATF